MKKTIIPNYISTATARVAPDLLKSLAILSDTTVTRSAVDREDLKPSRKSKGTFLKVIITPIIYKFLKVFSCRNLPNNLKFWDHIWKFQKPSNNLENRILPDTYWRVQLETMKVQATRPNAFEISKLIMTSLTNFRFRKIVYSSRLVPEGKKQIRWYRSHQD